MIKHTKRPRQEGTRDLKQFLAGFDKASHRIPRKLRDAWCHGQGGSVFRQMAREAFLAKQNRRAA